MVNIDTKRRNWQQYSNIPLRLLRQSKETLKWHIKKSGLEDTLNLMDLYDIYRTFYPKAAGYTSFSSAHRTFFRVEHMLGHETSLNKFSICLVAVNLTCSILTKLILTIPMFCKRMGIWNCLPHHFTDMLYLFKYVCVCVWLIFKEERRGTETETLMIEKHQSSTSCMPPTGD